jgi:dihydroorotate dehydrogenase electron transfer subunit
MDCRLLSKKALNERYILMIYELPTALPAVSPGQFVQVKVDHAPGTFLRRPISICRITAKNELWLLVQQIGEGTKTLGQLPVGAYTNMILPLGKGFTLPERPSRSLLIGGGVGVAPLLFLAGELADRQQEVHLLLGGRTASDVVLRDEFSRYGQLYYTTEDGTAGEKGVVTDHSLLKTIKPDRIYCCGPKPMMQAVALYAKKQGIPCEVSLENLMACGIGACLCCVENTVDGYVCTCTEGPVFNTNRLTW